jgi:hypothetical protein
VDKGAMKKDTMAKDMMTKDTMAKDTMSKDGMAPTSLMLTGTSVDLGKHVGHKVSITGSSSHEKADTMATVLSVKSLKMIAASCS